MNFDLKLSLEHIALVRIAASLWDQANIRSLIAKSGIPLNPYQKCENWHYIEDRVIENVRQLPQPESLKQKILGFIKPIGLEILKWIKYHPRNCFSIDVPNDFHWTPQGTIDKQKTAEALIKEEKLDVKICYNLACIYCLENHILELWHKLPEDCRNMIYSRNVIYITEGPFKIIQQDLVFLWTDQIAAKTGKLNDSFFQYSFSISQDAFEFAVTFGNKVAMEYFLPKLKSEDREVALVNAAGLVSNSYRKYYVKNSDPYKEYSTEVFFFLLSHMREEDQKEMIKDSAYRVLKCFLDWPLQNCFIDNTSLLLEFLSESHYISLLEIIINKVNCGFKDCDYLNLFSEFWNQAPQAHRKYVTVECASTLLLQKLFQIRDIQYIKLIFQDTSAVMKKCFIFGRFGLDICKQLIYDDKWDILNFFITECIRSKPEMRILIDMFEEGITKNEFVKMKDKWSKLFQLFEDILCELETRK